MSENTDVIIIDHEPDIVVGEHLIIEFNECKANLTDKDFIEKMMLDAVDLGGMTYMNHVVVPFPPQGSLSVVVVVAESHLSIHTWVEHAYAQVDINSCGDPDKVHIAATYLRHKLESDFVRVTKLKRGVFKRD